MAMGQDFSMTTHGTVGEFDQSREQWPSYAERKVQYFMANDVKEDTKQRAILLSVCGPSTYQLIRNLVAPQKATEFKFMELVARVQEHFCPRPSVIEERFSFHSRFQKEGVNVADYVAKLRRLVQHCKFGNTLEDMLRDLLVCGLMTQDCKADFWQSQKSPLKKHLD